MNFLVIGCGSIGQRHIRNLKNLGHQICGYERDPFRAKQVGEQYGIEIFTDFKAALRRKYDGAFICTPTSLHIPVSIELAKKGINLFIEKPISNSLKNIDKLVTIINKKYLVSLIGCNMRFSSGLKLVKRIMDENKIGKILSVKIEYGFYLPYWHPYEDYRKGYSANKSLGGGVILDDIHEIDMLCWLFGEVKEVFCFADKISNLEIDTEDVAEIFLKFKKGTIAQIHLDYLQQTYRRYYEFIGEKGLVAWDYVTQSVKLYSMRTGHWKVFHKSINPNSEIMFIDEVKHFISCIRHKKQSVNDISSARKTLEVALACYNSARKRKIITL